MKKIKVKLYINEERQEQESGDALVITKDNSFSLQNENQVFPVLTIAMDKDGSLMINTNSVSYINKKTMEIKA